MKSHEFINEGVNDPAIFKVVFVVGGPGSGKSYVASKLGLTSVIQNKEKLPVTTSGPLGYTVMNSDIPFEYLMKKHNLDPKMPPSQDTERNVQRQRAKEIAGTKSELAIQGRLGVVIDGTGDDYEKIARLKSNFNALGYEDYLVIVNTKLEVARQRNQKRARTVPDEIVVDSWYAVQNNIGRFAQIFENMSIIDNSGDESNTEEQINQAYSKLVKFTNKEPSNPIAKKWIEQNSVTNEASYEGNIGMEEMWKFKKWTEVNERPDMWVLLKKLSVDNPEAAWELLQKVLGVKLKEAEKRTAASMEIREKLKSAGYKLLGSGVDATVWAKKSGPVVKIIMPSDGRGAGASGDTFMKFYEFCEQHAEYENLPKFPYKASAFQADGKDYMMITMERLKPIPRGSFEEAMVWILSDLATKNMRWKDVQQEINNEDTWDIYNEMPTQQIIKIWNSLGNRGRSEYELLFNLMKVLYHTGKINREGWDLHTENAMMRDNTIVITDPWLHEEAELST